MTLKIGAGQSSQWLAFEAEVPPGFDVGADVHGDAEESSTSRTESSICSRSSPWP
jgi:hypothetical protein